jgi:magnesium chelatase family protein
MLLAACLHVLHGREHAPADLPKDAASLDLPIAMGTLIGSGQVTSELLNQYAIVGELALDGATRPTKGALSMAIAAAENQQLRPWSFTSSVANA